MRLIYTPLLTLFCVFSFYTQAQKSTYKISFENAVHHEANVNVIFSELEGENLTVRMSSASPGRYAVHHFAKNIYGVKATDSKGTPLKIMRPDPFSWKIMNHDGEVNLNYILFANRGDGTYSQIDETHAHLNMPATFMFAPTLEDFPMEITFNVRKDLNWKVATQLKETGANMYWAPNLQYFMDSPTEVSDFSIRSFDVDGQTIRFVLHHHGTEEELDTYFENVKKTVLEQKKVFGELPEFDFDTYTFLACYIPNASGDGMEHRNSTILTSTRSLANGGMQGNIGTVSHEFFHAWNVERIRPQSLEPFDFTKANMSGALWFAEGFTSYYTNLILSRAGVITPEQYIKSLNGTFNYVWNSPARQYFNPIEMSYQAPFVDAATSIDPVNRENTFISYYSYGSVLGLALDLSLRAERLNLDDYMKLVWIKYGKKEQPYTIKNLEEALKEYAGTTFATNFFNNYIYKSEMPDYKTLFSKVGIQINQDASKAYSGISLNGQNAIQKNIAQNTPAYKAKLDMGDTILSIDGKKVDGNFKDLITNYKPGDKITVEFERYGIKKNTTLILSSDPTYTISIDDKASKKQLKKRSEWLLN
ncbi:M61 family metallopeptidase [Zhouia amylolytica]|uniref:Metallopeptidase n=1 Tax=Zhouia amylolytica AD3 TaxID=1286632 RepID=W2UMG4_9FLAO|nr:PDZ domain-containing protein [Zhouia amylolytica]ETN94656.1 metallopeptidase [Zhouia amylolytica AD3]